MRFAATRTAATATLLATSTKVVLECHHGTVKQPNIEDVLHEPARCHSRDTGDHFKGVAKGFGCMFFSDGGHFKGAFENGNVGVAVASPSAPNSCSAAGVIALQA